MRACDDLSSRTNTTPRQYYIKTATGTPLIDDDGAGRFYVASSDAVAREGKGEVALAFLNEVS